MKTRIYYFTGTGNSLWAARTLGERLGGTTLTPIPRALVDGDTEPAEDRVGIVAPVYMYRIPHIVERFVRRLRTVAPVFYVSTMGSDAGDLFGRVEKLFRAQSLKLAVAMPVRLPSNYLPFGGVPPDDKLASVFETAAVRVNEIAGVIQRGETRVEPAYDKFRAWVHPGQLYRLGHKYIPQADKGYLLDDGCDGCGICALVCPVDNVAMTEERPVWKGQCEQCMACLQWCPHEVIQVKDKTRGERRYHHPEVRSKDIVAQKRRK